MYKTVLPPTTDIEGWYLMERLNQKEEVFPSIRNLISSVMIVTWAPGACQGTDSHSLCRLCRVASRQSACGSVCIACFLLPSGPWYCACQHRCGLFTNRSICLFNLMCQGLLSFANSSFSCSFQLHQSWPYKSSV